MLALRRLRLSPRVRALAVRARPRLAVTNGILVPTLFVVFALWGLMMAIPSLRAVAVGIPLTDKIGVLEHGDRVLRPVWYSALPGICLGVVGILGSAWAFYQYRMPDPPPSERP